MNGELRLLHMPSLKPRQHSQPGPLGCNRPSQGSHFRILSPTLLKNSISRGKLCKEAAHAVFWATQGHRAGRLIPLPLQRSLGHTGAVSGARPPPSAEPLKGALSSLMLQPHRPALVTKLMAESGSAFLPVLSPGPWQMRWVPTSPLTPHTLALGVSPSPRLSLLIPALGKDHSGRLHSLIHCFFFIPPATPHGWWDLSSWTRDWTHTLDSECTKSQPLKTPGKSFPCFPLFLICLWGNCRSTQSPVTVQDYDGNHAILSTQVLSHV